jgi:aromatic-L-amino-acid/L-tryptophan decarboxylase
MTQPQNDSNQLNITLDPSDWSAMRKLGHQMMDDMMDFLEHVHERPVWHKMPDEVKAQLRTGLPREPTDPKHVYDEFKQNILPYTKGNIHPRFFAWVEGTGTPMGVLGDLLASAMNPNTTIGEHSAMYVDQQVVNWCKEMMNYPKDATGILLSGASMANITAINVARNSQLKKDVRKQGLKNVDGPMVMYCSTETHSCVQKAAESAGLGTDAVRKIKVNEQFQIDTNDLAQTIEADFHNGLVPFCIIGNAGTVNTGAIDSLEELHVIAQRNNLWLHIDGAFGAVAKMVPGYGDQLKAIEKADSVAFDFHKWLYMPYEIGCVLIRDAKAHRDSFSVTPSYLAGSQRGLAGGPDPITNYGLELSRGFKALKVWMSLKEHGIGRYIQVIEKNLKQALYLEEQIKIHHELEMLTPVTMNIVCFRYKLEYASEDERTTFNKELLIQLQEQGIAAPSSTVLHGRYAIRVSITNQRTKQSDLDLLVKETLRIGNELIKQKFIEPSSSS